MGYRISVFFSVLFCLLLPTLAQYPPAGEQYAPGQIYREVTVQKQLEFHTAIAERLFNTVAKIINAKVNLILWFKKMFISLLVRGIAYVNYFIANNQEFVSNQIDLLSAVMKSWVTNVPYFNVPSVAKTASVSSNSEYVNPATEPTWLYEMPNQSLFSTILNIGSSLLTTGNDDSENTADEEERK